MIFRVGMNDGLAGLEDRKLVAQNALRILRHDACHDDCAYTIRFRLQSVYKDFPFGVDGAFHIIQILVSRDVGDFRQDDEIRLMRSNGGQMVCLPIQRLLQFMVHGIRRLEDGGFHSWEGCAPARPIVSD